MEIHTICLAGLAVNGHESGFVDAIHNKNIKVNVTIPLKVINQIKRLVEPLVVKEMENSISDLHDIVKFRTLQTALAHTPAPQTPTTENFNDDIPF